MYDFIIHAAAAILVPCSLVSSTNQNISPLAIATFLTGRIDPVICLCYTVSK